MQSAIFILREGIAGLMRSRFTGFVAVLTIAISLILIGVFLIITVNLAEVVDRLRSRVELEVFLDDSLDEAKIDRLAEEMASIDGVSAVTFISKEMAIREFESLFDDQQHDYFDVLGFNPLPASFRIKLRDAYRNAAGAERVAAAIGALVDIGEEDVVYRRKFVVLLEKYIKIAIAVDFLVGTIVCLSALLLVTNNIRLIILSKSKIIETMMLVGATRAFVQLPLFIQGMIQGLVGGIISALFLYAVLMVGSIEIPGLISVSWRIYALLTALGVLLGLAGSYTAVRRYL